MGTSIPPEDLDHGSRVADRVKLTCCPSKGPASRTLSSRDRPERSRESSRDVADRGRDTDADLAQGCEQGRGTGKVCRQRELFGSVRFAFSLVANDLSDRTRMKHQDLILPSAQMKVAR